MNSPLLKTLIADISAHTTAGLTAAPTRKKGCDIDAQVLALVLQKPGSRRIDLLDMPPDGLTETAVAESLHRLKTGGKVIAVQDRYTIIQSGIGRQLCLRLPRYFKKGAWPGR